MTLTRFWLAPHATFILGFALVGCDGDDATTTEHDHDTPIEVDADNPPSLELEVTEDPMSGHNLRATLEKFELAPEHASTRHVEGEGHMHIYVDGEKLTRLDSEWFHLGGLDAGEHDIRVELSANSHNPLALDGEIIDAETTITVRASEHGHAALDPIEVSDPVPSLKLEVVDDPTSGWNLHAEVDDFRLAPENASTDHVDGEGHMHIYVNGEKLTRLYGEWFYLDALQLGEVELRVELSANSHNPLAHDGEIIEAVHMLTVTESDSHTHGEQTHHGEGGAGGEHSE